MNESTQALQALVEQIRKLVNEARWEELSELDESARSTVEQATNAVREQECDETQVRTLIEQLVALYDQARARAEEERDEAERGLSETSRTQRAANAYLNNQ